MSIVALKRKTRAQYHNMSEGRTGFSLNGTHRSQGFVGQTMLSRSLPRTPMVGNTVRGHGGLNGAYAVANNVVSGIRDQNDPSVIKSSVLDTNGMMMTKYRWSRRPQPFAVVKPDHRMNNADQQTHIELVRKHALQCFDEHNAQYKVNGTYVKSVPPKTACPYTKSAECGYIAKPDKVTDYQQYMLGKDQQCAVNMDWKDIQDARMNKPTLRGTPFACSTIR